MTFQLIEIKGKYVSRGEGRRITVTKGGTGLIFMYKTDEDCARLNIKLFQFSWGQKYVAPVFWEMMFIIVQLPNPIKRNNYVSLFQSQGVDI